MFDFLLSVIRRFDVTHGIMSYTGGRVPAEEEVPVGAVFQFTHFAEVGLNERAGTCLRAHAGGICQRCRCW